MQRESESRITYIGTTNHRNAGVAFGIRQSDRYSHFYITGKTGTGKSHLLRLMFNQDMLGGQGCALLDPHGDLVQSLRSSVPVSRICDLVYLEVADTSIEWRFNPLSGVPRKYTSLAVAGIIEAFKSLWTEDWGPRLEHLLRNTIFTLLETPGSTLADIPQLLTDKAYRSSLICQIENKVVRDFWITEFDRYSPAFRSVVAAPVQNKIGAILTDPLLRRIMTEPGRPIDLDNIMDNRKILLVNLDKGRIGEGPATVLGSLLLSHIALAGLRRSGQPELTRQGFFVYLDEFQTFTTLSIAKMLSELRKYRVGLILANQHLAQLEPDIRNSVFGNVGSMVSFRSGAADAEYLAREFAPVFDSADLISLPLYHIYIKLQINGATSRPFSATTLAEAP